MKKFNTLFYLSALFAAFTFSSCEGPMGPAGKDGTNGTDGIDGTNGTAVCQACHTNDQVMLAKVEQYNESFHAKGENAAYANNSGAACTQCHVSQGFVDYIKNGKVSNTTTYTNPLQPNCYTCHKVHTTFTTSDWALTTTDAVTMTRGGASYNKGNSNLCANCHQARALSPELPSVGGASVTLTSTRWGTHHAPMANVLLGQGLYEVVGSISYSTNVHATISKGCVQCHMSDPYGTMAGGHNMGMEYDSHGTALINVKGCSPCHANTSSAEQTALRTKISTEQASIQTLLTQLETLLVSKGIYDSATGLNKTGTFTADVAGAYINYQSIKEDKSLGVHNPQYAKALLQNSIEKLSVK